MRVALLGSTGFVGKNIEKILSEMRADWFPVSRTFGYDLRKKEDNLKFIEESKCHIIINCAAHVGSLNYVTQKAGEVISDNLNMLNNLYEAVSESNPQIIIIQPVANCAYPANSILYKEDEVWNGPLHPSVMAYGITRRLMLSLSESYLKQFAIRSINLLCPNMYGPFDSTDPNKAHALNALVSKFIKAKHTNQESVEVWGTGSAVREWLFAEDFAKIIQIILENLDDKKFDSPVNIAQEYGLNVRALVNLILKNVSYSGNVWYNTNMPDGAPIKVMSREKFDKVFEGFKFTDFATGISKTASYYETLYPY